MIESSATHSEKLVVFAQMLRIAERQQDKAAVDKYAEALGQALNKLITESLKWSAK